MLTAKHTCARGSHAVSINEQGRTGATGATGKTGTQGPKGDPGVAAPTPISIAFDATDTTTSSKTFTVGSTGMTVTGGCFNGRGDANDLVLTGTSDYYVHGSAQFLNSGGNLAARVVTPTGNEPISSGSSLIYYASSSSSTIETYVPKPEVKSEGAEQLYVDLVVLTGSQSFSIRLFEYFDGARCQQSTQVIAS